MTEKPTQWKNSLYQIIFESDTAQGRAFDKVLISLILFSSLVVLLDSVEELNQAYGKLLFTLEWFFAIIFTLEYILRIISIPNRSRYIVSFFGIIDLLSILPAYISLIYPAAQVMMVVRILRLLRLFRIFKMTRYIRESSILMRAIKASRPKITVFVFTILFVVTVVGSLMYIVEGGKNGYSSIPQSMYWAIVTVTTVGYGDVSPQTPLGKFIASLLMISAYGILAVPTGILTYEFGQAAKKPADNLSCPHCSASVQALDARFCHQCGDRLHD